jgi:hypothetical protein
MPAMSTNDTGAGRIARAEDLGELVQPRVGQRHHALVRLDRRERVVRRQHVVRVSALNRVDLPTLGRPTIPR